MLPNNEIMYKYARNRSKEIQTEVALSRGESFRPHTLAVRRSLAVIVGVGLVGLTLVVLTLALGWWVL